MPLTKQTLLLLALSTTVRADVNHDFQARCPGVSNERGGCYSAGFVDKIQSAEDCQAMCQANPDCEFFSWHYTRGDKRCHLCKDDRTHHKCYPSPNNNCWWGPKYCEGAEEPTPAEKARAAVDAAELICTNPGAVDGEATIKAATDLSAAVKLLVRGELDASDFEGADAAAAAVLARTGCAFNPCNGGAALWSVLETFLLAIDGDADRAFPQPQDRFRKQLFNESGAASYSRRVDGVGRRDLVDGSTHAGKRSSSPTRTGSRRRRAPRSRSSSPSSRPTWSRASRTRRPGPR